MRLTEQIADLLEPVRDVYVADLLAAQAEALGKGADVDAEPVDRDGAGHIRRFPPLVLPVRHDFAIRRDDVTRLKRVPGVSALRFDPIVAPVSDVVSARIAPFNWGAVVVHAEAAHGGGAASQPDWTPLRRWFLEWFQARFGEESPDLLGVVHRLSGPDPDGTGWRFTVDLGSCSVRGFLAMLDALAASGCADIRIGETQNVS